jgi:hypothetical protein
VASEGERAPELLRADKEQLDRAAGLLAQGEQAFVVVVGPEEMWAEARNYMKKQAGVDVPEPVLLSGPEAALDALLGALPQVEGASMRSLALGIDERGALDALNLHREKVLRGAPVVLWLDGVEGLSQMREVAPDAYAFRDMVVMVRGDGGRLPDIGDDSPRIARAALRVKRAKTALDLSVAYARLSEELRAHGRVFDAERIARLGVEVLPEDRHTGEVAHLLRATAWVQVAAAASRGSPHRQGLAVERGLADLEGADIDDARKVRIFLLVMAPGPFGDRDRRSAAEAHAEAHHFDAATEAQTCRTLSRVASEVGDIRWARSLLKSFDADSLGWAQTSLLGADHGRTERLAGNLREAEAHLLRSTSLRHTHNAPNAFIAHNFALCWLDKAELDTTERIVRESLQRPEPIHTLLAHSLLAKLSLGRGDVDRARANAHLVLLRAAQLDLDGFCLITGELLADIAGEAAEAAEGGRIDDASRLAIGEIDVAEDVSRALTGNNPPPWYPIRFLGFRTTLLMRTEQRDDALALARRALDLARTTYPDLIPEAGRALANHLLRAGKPDEALPVLAEVEPEAVSRGMLKELGRIRAARVLALVLRNEPPAAVEPAMAALREALESTGAPRIKAETLQELAIRLPPDTTLPDPLALATETHALFVEMPMPAEEARSLELAGDILAARGKPADAKRRYLTARGILERRGLGLRLPLLASKIDRLA